MPGLQKFFRKILSRYLPNLYDLLISKGLINEPRWINLNIGCKGKETIYLKDDHRDRIWFCDFVEQINGRSENTSILEIGAGGMYEVNRLKDKGILQRCEYHVVDISKEVINIGKNLFPQVNFRTGSINRIPFQDNSMDVVYCRHLIEHQPGYERAIKEMLRVSCKIVIINIFRWTTGETIISREKKYSNTYNIQELVEFCRNNCIEFDYFVLKKDEAPGINIYDDPVIIRSTDHAIFFLSKGHGLYDQAYLNSLKSYQRFLVRRPYDSNPPKYQPQLKAV